MQCFPHQTEGIAMYNCLKSYRLIVLYVSVEKKKKKRYMQKWMKVLK